MATDNEIASLYAAALESSATIADLCRELFGKEQFVRQGLHEGRELSEKNAPFFVVLPFSDADGFEAEESTVKVVITIGLVDRTWVKLGQRGERARGLDSMEQVEAALREVLGDTQEPPSRWTGEYENPGPDFFIRHILFEIENINTIG
jgi:hypothetical protein